jgi:hypothetical protein
MQTHVVERGTAPTVSPVLTHLRAQLTALTFPSPYLSEAERLLANHHIHECEDEGRLQIWLRNVASELAQREVTCYSQYGPCSVDCYQHRTLNMRPFFPTQHS